MTALMGPPGRILAAVMQGDFDRAQAIVVEMEDSELDQMYLLMPDLDRMLRAEHIRRRRPKT